MPVMNGAIRFISAEDGGRQGPPPSGPIYMATGLLTSDFATSHVDAGTGSIFSIVIELEDAVVGRWSRVTVCELVDDAPGSEVLRSAAEISILEGHREVARLVIDADSP